jgi:hypothetical protein
MRRLSLVSVVAAAVMAALCSLPAAAGLVAQPGKVYFGIEIDGVLCGYSEHELSYDDEDGKFLVLKSHVTIMLEALGADVNSEVRLTYHIDPETGQFFYHDSEIKQGQMELQSRIYIEGDQARCEYSLGEDRVVDLPSDVLLENTLIYPHLIRDFVEGSLTEQTYHAFDVREGEVQNLTYNLIGREHLDLAGATYEAVGFDVSAERTGLNYQVWIDAKTGYLLKSVVGKRAAWRADSSIGQSIRKADVDGLILAPVDIEIPDIHSISYMKVRAKLEPSGLRITPEGLNVPGQSFTGTVENNRVDGVFEIEHKRYDGAGAPAFPPDFSSDPNLKEFLGPDGFIEADDPVLVDKAEEITRNSRDAWEAATRLSEWVAQNIGYAIPGGGSARKTYDIRAGECGAHSFLLASFCRAVGIPARVVWGCMYVSNRGGAFGQHGWNEIYMGDAGWIPVDATAMETRFVDSGHIRLGAYQSMTTAFNPMEMEVLDYRLTSGEASDAGGADDAVYRAYLGQYMGPRGLEATVSLSNGTLTVHIPGTPVLPFADPDGAGRWFCRLAGNLFMDFTEEDGEVRAMNIHEVITMPRQSDPEEIEDDTPPQLLPYLGRYLFPQAQAEFQVILRDGGLAVHDPLEDAVVRLKSPDTEGRWLDEFGKNTITFERDADGKVTAMKIDAPSEFIRK